MVPMTRITLRQLEYFRTIAATGSLRAAAEREYVSRSTIAAALTDLERALDTQLCIRHKSTGIELTESGKAVLDIAATIGGYVDDLESLAGDSTLKGILTVGCFGSLAPTVLPTLVKQFMADHPGVEVVTVTDSTDVLIDLLTSGRLDLIISYKLHVVPALTVRRLFETRMYVVLPPEHRLAAGDVVDAADLVHEPLVMITTPPSEEDVTDYFDSIGLSPHVRFRISNFEYGRSLIAAGLGYGLYLQRPLHDLTYEGAPLVAKPLRPMPTSERVSIAWPRDRRLTAKASSFVELTQSWGARLAPVSVYDGRTDAESGASAVED